MGLASQGVQVAELRVVVRGVLLLLDKEAPEAWVHLRLRLMLALVVVALGP
jgi:hypothetical protein